MLFRTQCRRPTECAVYNFAVADRFEARPQSLVPTLAWIMHVLRPRHLATSEPPDIVACHVRRALRGQIVVSTAKSIHRLGKKLLAYAIRTNSSMPWDLRSERRGQPKNLQIFPTRFCLRFSIRHIGPTTFPAESKRMQHSPLATRHSPLATRHSPLVIGHWSLVIGHWSLVIGQRSAVSGLAIPNPQFAPAGLAHGRKP
jgi:hypothetical protein